MSSGYYNKGVATGAKAQNVEWFTSDIDPGIRSEKMMELTLQISLSITPVVVEITMDSGTTWSALNTGVAIPIGKLHSFSVLVKNDDLVNFRTPNASGTTLDYCYVIGGVDSG
jgi:hypothetical protein